MIRKSQNHGLYTHKSLNFEHNGKDSTHSIAGVLSTCATVRHTFLVENFYRRTDKYQRFR